MVVDFQDGCINERIKNGPEIGDILGCCTNKDESVVGILEDQTWGMNQRVPNCSAILDQALQDVRYKCEEVR